MLASFLGVDTHTSHTDAEGRTWLAWTSTPLGKVLWGDWLYNWLASTWHKALLMKRRHRRKAYLPFLAQRANRHHHVAEHWGEKTLRIYLKASLLFYITPFFRIHRQNVLAYFRALCCQWERCLSSFAGGKSTLFSKH